MNTLKLMYIISVAGTLFSGGMIGYTIHQNLLLDTIYFTPLFAVFYPIALFGTIGYAIKHAVQNMSMFDIMEKAGVDAGLGGMLGGLGGDTMEEEE